MSSKIPLVRENGVWKLTVGKHARIAVNKRRKRLADEAKRKQ